LSKRSKKVLYKFIDIKQSTLLENIGLLDIMVVANQVLDEVQRKKDECIIVKVEFEKAYDSVNWGYLEYMMEN